MSQPNDFRFGYMAVKKGYVTMEQIKECVLVKADLQADGLDLKLGEVLVRKGYLTTEQAEEIASVQAQQAPAQVIAGFQPVRKLGEGAMGAVYKAKQLSLDRYVALKILPKRLASNKEFVARFQREAKMVALLSHPNIVRGIVVGEENGIHYLAMEYVEGESIGQKIARDGRLPWQQSLGYILQIAGALTHAHGKEVLHRDIKPDNILIEAATETAKLADMGLARLAAYADSDDPSLTQAGDVVGTPNYVAPEQARGEMKLDGRADIYSLGATFYHMVTGVPPYKGTSAALVMTMHITEPLVPPRERNTQLPVEVSRVIETMMGKDPAQRYQNAQELVDALGHLQRVKDTGQSSEHSSAPAQMPARSDSSRHKTAGSQSEAPDRVSQRATQIARRAGADETWRGSVERKPASKARRKRRRRGLFVSVLRILLLLVLFVLLALAGGSSYVFVVEGWTLEEAERWITPYWQEIWAQISGLVNSEGPRHP